MDDYVFSSRPTSSVDSTNSFKPSNIPQETLSSLSNLSKTDSESFSSSINAPPPIPPHINSSQSNSRTSGSSQSDRSTIDTPPDEAPPLFAYRTGSGQSDDEPPPAIPPRARIKKQSKRGT